MTLTDGERRVLDAIDDLSRLGESPTGLDLIHYLMEHMRTTEVTQTLRGLRERGLIESVS